MMGMMRLFCGRTFDESDWNRPHLKEHLNEIKDHIVSTMKGTMESRLRTWYDDTSLSYNATPKWLIGGTLDLEKVERAQRDFMSYTVNALAGLLEASVSNFRCHVNSFLSSGFNSKSYSAHERIEVGDLIQVLVCESNVNKTFIEVSHDGQGAPAFYIVGGIVAAPSGDIWLVIKRCGTDFPSAQLPNYNQPLLVPASWGPFYKGGQRMFSFLLLDHRVRKIGCIHDCGKLGQCKYCTSTRTVEHSTTTLLGGSFFLLNRYVGYPPRRS